MKDRAKERAHGRLLIAVGAAMVVPQVFVENPWQLVFWLGFCVAVAGAFKLGDAGAVAAPGEER